MTRKDYNALAARLAKVRAGYAPSWNPNLFRAHADACGAVADALAADNSRFDRARFLAACGLPAEAQT